MDYKSSTTPLASMDLSDYVTSDREQRPHTYVHTYIRLNPQKQPSYRENAVEISKFSHR